MLFKLFIHDLWTHFKTRISQYFELHMLDIDQKGWLDFLKRKAHEYLYLYLEIEICFEFKNAPSKVLTLFQCRFDLVDWEKLIHPHLVCQEDFDLNQ